MGMLGQVRGQGPERPANLLPGGPGRKAWGSGNQAPSRCKLGSGPCCEHQKQVAAMGPERDPEPGGTTSILEHTAFVLHRDRPYCRPARRPG